MMGNRSQAVLFLLITLIGTGVVFAAVTRQPSRYDPVGTQNIMLGIGGMVTGFAAVCALLSLRQWHAGQEEGSGTLYSIKSGAMFIVGAILLSIPIVERVIRTEWVLLVIYCYIGLLVIHLSPDQRFSRRALGNVAVSGGVLTFGVTQVFTRLLGLPPP